MDLDEQVATEMHRLRIEAALESVMFLYIKLIQAKSKLHLIMLDH